MSQDFENFKPMVWSTKVQMASGPATVLEKDCDYQFQGEIKKNARLKIIGVARPTVYDYGDGPINPPEHPADASQYLDVDQQKYWNIGVDDIDEAQSNVDIMNALTTGGGVALAEVRDSYIASLFAGATYMSEPATITDEKTAKTAIDGAIQVLMDHYVRPDYQEVTMYLPPAMLLKFGNALFDQDTNNHKAMQTGALGSYWNVGIKQCSNLYNDGTYTYVPVKTKKAVAAANCISKVEALRSSNRFENTVRCLNVYGAKIVRQDELYVIKFNDPRPAKK